MHASVQEFGEKKVDAVLQVKHDADRLLESVRRLLEVDHGYYTAVEQQQKSRRLA